MDYTFRSVLFIIVFIATLFACKNKKNAIDTSKNITSIVESKITIYGSENCDHCIVFRKKMDSVNIKYEFKDAEAHEQYNQELFLKIQQANFKGDVSFPVLEVDDKIYVRPEFSEFIKLFSK